MPRYKVGLTWSGLGGGDEDWGCKVCGGGYLGVSWGLRVGVEIVESLNRFTWGYWPG